jgi:hypothetical protein
VGAYYDDDNGSNSGSAYILKRHADGWHQHTKLLPDNGASDDRFGYAVDISGDFAIVGAYYDDPTTNAGSAYIFRRSGNVWQQEDYFYANDYTANDYFGHAVSIDGHYAIVGAYGDDVTYTDQGSAYIFKRSGADWVQEAKLTASDREASDQFGIAVSISGDYAVVGAYLEDAKGSDAGAAYIFKRDGSSWSQQAKITASDGASSDHFGRSVSISENRILVGAYLHDANGSNTGAVYVLKGMAYHGFKQQS